MEKTTNQPTNNQSGLAVKSTVKAGGIRMNHTQGGLAVKSAVKACGIHLNHSQRGPVTEPSR
jgi:hypothetical protein